MMNNKQEDWENEEEDWENVCECGRPGVSNCDCCGSPLCFIHAECNGNFCNACLCNPHMSERMEQLYAEMHGEESTI